jgi:hypothetical protein
MKDIVDNSGFQVVSERGQITLAPRFPILNARSSGRFPQLHLRVYFLVLQRFESPLVFVHIAMWITNPLLSTSRSRAAFPTLQPMWKTCG